MVFSANNYFAGLMDNQAVYIVITALATVLLFGFLIFIHEFGHYLTARLFGVIPVKSVNVSVSDRRYVSVAGTPFGIKMFRRLYGEDAVREDVSAVAEEDNVAGYREARENSYSKLATWEGLLQLGRILALTVGVAAVSAGVAVLFPDNFFMAIFILMITTLGVACSFLPAVKKFDVSYDAGMYLIYIFSITIASMADFSTLSLESGVGLLGFMAVVVFISLALHAVLCRLMKVDADSMTISSVAFINSPPFVPMVSAAMKNRDALVTGLAAGIVGYAIGNHLGVLIAQLL